MTTEACTVRRSRSVGGSLIGLLGSASVLALSLAAPVAVAVAADLGGGSKGDPYTAPAPMWSGLYVGAAVGYSFGSSTVDIGGGTVFDTTLRGEHGAVTVGYDFQIAPRWVAGVFADFALGSTQLEGIIGVDLDNQWAIGGRLGVLATPSTLLYGSAGFTGAHFEATEQGLVPFVKGTLDGYFVGFGGEQALSRNLSLKAEYRFSDYGDIAGTADTETSSSDNSVHSLRLGVSYRFGN
jgi:outer membrane immunogenic protein